MDKLTNETNASDTESQEQPSLTPGSVHLVDLEQRLQAKHASGRDKDIVLDPAPSSDPDDPLNWSPRRKLLSTICLGIYATIIAMGTAVTFAIIVPMSKATELTVNDLNAGTGYIYLLSGWSALLVQPLALQYGKRPVYLISLLAHVVVMVWAPYTRTNGQWIANKIVQGFFAAPVASLCEASVADVYYTHQRGRYMAVFTMCIVGGVTLAPVIFGFVNDGQGWRWVLFWMGIFAAVAFVFCFLFMEETNYYRRRPAGASSSSEKAAWESPPRQLDPLAKDEEVKEATFDDYTSVDRSFTRGKPKSFLQKLYLFDREASRRPIHLKGMMVRPLVFFSFPIICYAGFCWGCIVVSHIMYNATASLILSNPPYNFSARMVGLSFIAGLIGVIIAAAFSGKFGDWFIIQMARRNGGVMEPEHRQWLFLVSVVLLPASLILWVSKISLEVPPLNKRLLLV